MSDDTALVVGTIDDDVIELILGAQTHMLVMADFTLEFDASIDTFHIGGAQGVDSIRIVGTDLDDVAKAIDDRGTFSSSNYSVFTYAFESMHFEGHGGYDYTEIFGSDERDILQGLPQDTTLTTPDSTLRMTGFQRVDAYGRGGDDYGEVYGTLGDDHFYSFDAYQVLLGEEHHQNNERLRASRCLRARWPRYGEHVRQ